MLEYLKLRLTFEAASELSLTRYKGSVLRGLFKTSLRRLVCPIPRVRCEDCMLISNCAYHALTENQTETGENTVQPYAIACSGMSASRFSQGDLFSCELLLIEKAISLLPYIAYSISEWKRSDVSRFQPFISDAEIAEYGNPVRWGESVRPHGRMALHSIEHLSSEGLKPIYHHRDGTLYSPTSDKLSPAKQCKMQNAKCKVKPNSPILDDCHQKNHERVTIRFLSPVRLFRKMPDTGKRTLISPELFDFSLLFRSLLTRFTGLYTHFGKGDGQIGKELWQKFQQDVESVRLCSNNLRWEKIRRYKAHNTRWTLMDGIIGEVVFDNVSPGLIPWIKAGEILQIGKFPTMGFGEMQCNVQSEACKV